MARMKRIAVYAGSFDPLTNGHLWMIKQGARMFDELIVAIGDNPDKHYTFSHEERMTMLRVALSDMPDVRIAEFHNRFLVDFANEHGATFMLRGIRSTQDYEYERVMRHINADMAPKVCTVFLMPPRDTAELSSSMIKGLIGPEGWESQVSRYVPPQCIRHAEGEVPGGFPAFLAAFGAVIRFPEREPEDWNACVFYGPSAGACAG